MISKGFICRIVLFPNIYLYSLIRCCMSWYAEDSKDKFDVELIT